MTRTWSESRSSPTKVSVSSYWVARGFALPVMARSVRTRTSLAAGLGGMSSHVLARPSMAGEARNDSRA